MAARTNADQVQGNDSAATSVKGRCLLPSPNKRRSTIMIDPTTKASANTCTVSIVGNNHTDSRISVGKLRFCIQKNPLSNDTSSASCGCGRPGGTHYTYAIQRPAVTMLAPTTK